MKEFVLILSFILSCLFSGSGLSRDVDHEMPDGAVVECSGQETETGFLDFDDLALLPVRTATCSGNGNGISPSLRSTNSGSRIHHSTKSTHRIVKCGKVSDRNNLYSFQTALLQFQSGIHANSRYIHTICHLLI